MLPSSKKSSIIFIKCPLNVKFQVPTSVQITLHKSSPFIVLGKQKCPTNCGKQKQKRSMNRSVLACTGRWQCQGAGLSEQTCFQEKKTLSMSRNSSRSTSLTEKSCWELAVQKLSAGWLPEEIFIQHSQGCNRGLSALPSGLQSASVYPELAGKRQEQLQAEKHETASSGQLESDLANLCCFQSLLSICNHRIKMLYSGSGQLQQPAR